MKIISSIITNNTLLLLAVFFLIFVHSSFSKSEVKEDTSGVYTVDVMKPASIEVPSHKDVSDIANTYLKYSPDPITSLYNENVTRSLVRKFFLNKTKSEKITDTILFYAEQENIPIGIAFSLAFVESSFRPTVENVNKNASRDLGLFQLNTNTFRYMKKEDFFHLDTNVKAGIGYLKFAFSLDPDPKIALAIYNAGPSRPLRGIIPDSTQKYIKKILAYSKKLEAEFSYYMRKQPTS